MVKVAWDEDQSNKLKSLLNQELSYDQIQKEHFPFRTSNSLRLHGTRFLKIHNKYKHREYIFNKEFWKNPNLNNCYWAGFMATDGNVTKYQIRIELAAIDEGHLQKFKIDCGSTHPIKIYERADKGKFASFAVNSKNEWKRDLEENFSITPKKTHTLRPPNISGKDLKVSYLRGYIDGDGSICLTDRSGKKELAINILGASLPMIQWIKTEFDKITEGRGERQRNREICSKTGNHQYGAAGLKACVLFDYLSQLPTPILTRKWLKPEVLAHVAEQKLLHADKFVVYVPETSISV